MGAFKEPRKAIKLPQEPGEASENLSPSLNELVLFQIPFLLCICVGKQALPMQQMLLSPTWMLKGSPFWGPQGAEGSRLNCSQWLEDGCSNELPAFIRWTCLGPWGSKAEPLAVSWQHPPLLKQRFVCLRRDAAPSSCILSEIQHWSGLHVQPW